MSDLCPAESQLLSLSFSCRTSALHHVLSLQQSYNVIKPPANLKLQIEIIQLQALSHTRFSSGWHISTYNGRGAGRKLKGFGVSASAGRFQSCDPGPLIWSPWFIISTSSNVDGSSSCGWCEDKYNICV